MTNAERERERVPMFCTSIYESLYVVGWGPGIGGRVCMAFITKLSPLVTHINTVLTNKCILYSFKTDNSIFFIFLLIFTKKHSYSLFLGLHYSLIMFLLLIVLKTKSLNPSQTLICIYRSNSVLLIWILFVMYVSCLSL